VASWEERVLCSTLWQAHRDAHRRNFYRRFSETAEEVDPDSRLKPPRYWLVHTLAHVVVTAALAPAPTPDEQEERLRTWDPVDLLVPAGRTPRRSWSPTPCAPPHSRLAGRG
jgi:hypothetical protein